LSVQKGVDVTIDAVALSGVQAEAMSQEHSQPVVGMAACGEAEGVVEAVDGGSEVRRPQHASNRARFRRDPRRKIAHHTRQHRLVLQHRLKHLHRQDVPKSVCGLPSRASVLPQPGNDTLQSIHLFI